MLQQRLQRSRTIPLLLGALLAICLCYQGYRYPLQINSSQTSPTYSDTPLWLQAGKWGVIALVTAALMVAIMPRLRRTIQTAGLARLIALTIEVVMLALAVLPIAHGAADVEPKITLILVGVALIITLTPTFDDLTIRIITSVFIGFAVVCVVAQAAQLALFLAFGRLPALAWANSPSVRFGSLLDDPNGFAILLSALVPVAWIALRQFPNLRVVLTVALGCCLPLTQSWTGLACVPFALLITWACLRGIRRDVRQMGAAVLASLLVVGVAAYFARSTIAELVRLKQGSVKDHAASLDHIAVGSSPTGEPRAVPTPSTIIGLPGSTAHNGVGLAGTAHDPASIWTPGIESGHVNLLVNYGPVFLACYLTLGLIAAFLLLRGRTTLPLALRAGGAAYLICFLTASANLGLDRTFPCNVVYFAFCGFAFANTMARRRSYSTTAGAPMTRTGFIANRVSALSDVPDYRLRSSAQERPWSRPTQHRSPRRPRFSRPS